MGGKRERGQRGVGLDKIFELMSSGMSYQHVIDVIDDAEKQEQKGRERGAESEEIARQNLGALSYVAGVKVVSSNDKLDGRGRDMIVKLNGEAYARHFRDIWVHAANHVFVQVKSSQIGVDQFIKREQGIHRCGYNEALDRLRNRKLIVLNARDPVDTFYRNFETQLVAINEYWKTKDTPRSW